LKDDNATGLRSVPRNVTSGAAVPTASAMRTPEVGKMVADLSFKTPTYCGKFTDYD
jgi:hypothetical protein